MQNHVYTDYPQLEEKHWWYAARRKLINRLIRLYQRKGQRRWHDLPNRVIHREDVPLMRLRDLCDVRDGLSPNMGTPPGEFVLVVPAEGRKTADHWDFEAKAVCIPLVSSSGHGKADIKRLHYQEGKFALATTMCALFAKDEECTNPRFLYIFLSATYDDLLVPLMCGATNVTMNSSQLADVVIPVPDPSLQSEAVESYLIATKAAGMASTASSLRDSSSNDDDVQLARRVLSNVEELRYAAQHLVSVSSFLPT